MKLNLFGIIQIHKTDRLNQVSQSDLPKNIVDVQWMWN